MSGAVVWIQVLRGGVPTLDEKQSYFNNSQKEEVTWTDTAGSFSLTTSTHTSTVILKACKPGYTVDVVGPWKPKESLPSTISCTISRCAPLIHGYCLDTNSDPVTDVTAQVKAELEFNINTNGYYTLKGLRPGNHEIEYRASGCLPEFRSVSADHSSTQEISIIFSRASVVTGSVCDALTKLPIPDARIFQKSSQTLIAESDKIGQFFLYGIEACVLVCMHPDYADSTIQYKPSSEMKPPEVLMYPGGDLRVTINDSSHDSFLYTISVRNEKSPIYSNQKKWFAGSIVFTNLAACSDLYTISLRNFNNRSHIAEKKAKILPNDTTGHCIDQSSNAFKAFIKIWSENSTTPLLSKWTDSDGTFYMRIVPTGANVYIDAQYTKWRSDKILIGRLDEDTDVGTIVLFHE